MIELASGEFVNPRNITTIGEPYPRSYQGELNRCEVRFTNQQKLEISIDDRDTILKHMNGDANHE